MFISKMQYGRSFLLVLSMLFIYQTGIRLFSQNLKIYHIDVEQGDATLFISPSGNSLLIDCGKNDHGSRIASVLNQEGIDHVDFFVCTHYHEDHYGGIDDLINDENITIGQTYDRGDKLYIPQEKIDGPTYQGYDTTCGSDAVHLTRGMSIAFDDEVSVKCISSGGVVLAEEEPLHGHHENDMSISLLIKFGAFWYFHGADIETPTEAKIASRDLVTDVDVYKSSHHGSTTSSLRELLLDMIPATIVISNGNNGLYKHPRQATLESYASLDPVPLVLQTNKYYKGGSGGNVEDKFIADLESTDTDGTILIEVDNSSNKYTISYRDTSIKEETKSREVMGPGLFIESLLPNPEGDDLDLEEVVIRNRGNEIIQLAGAVLRDESGRVWPLDHLGSIGANESIKIMRNRMPMSLNNGGDTIYLISNIDEILDEYTYSSSKEGIRLLTNH